MNRKKLVLLICVVLLAVTATWSYLAMPRFRTVPPGTKTATQRPATPLKGNVDVKEAAVSPTATTVATAQPARPPSGRSAIADERVLRLDLLEQDQVGFKGYRRNIFKPVFVDEVKMLKLKAVAAKPLPVPPVAVVTPPPVQPPVQPLVQPPSPKEVLKSTLGQFTYLGFLKKDNRKTIFLSKDKEIILVRKGERFAKKYEATNITEQALTIKVSETGEEIVIPLTENKTLAASLK